MGRMDGKVVFITGAARGQGRAHAVRLAEEGADIIGVDLCEDIPTVPYPCGTESELAETVRSVEALGRRMVASAGVDVRDREGLSAALAAGVAELGRLDGAVANAGICTFSSVREMTPDTWQTMIDINLTGVFNTAQAAVEQMVEQGEGGSIVFTSSTGGFRGWQNVGHYVAAKHGIVGLARTLANEVAPDMIRVNTVHPTNVDTPMIMNELVFAHFRPDLEASTKADIEEVMLQMNALPRATIDPRDVANVVLFLLSDEARYVTASAYPVDLGAGQKA